jgi:hypothetical protein
MNITAEEVEALQHALPLAWPLMEQFAVESIEDAPKLAMAYETMARVVQDLYDRLMAG